MIVWILLAVIGGIAVALQAQIMGTISAEIGWLGNVYIAYVTGFLVVLVLVMAFGRSPIEYMRSPPSWYHYSAGVYGVIIVGTIGIGSYKLGLVPTLVIIFVSQITAGKVITHYGLLGVPVKHISLFESMAIILLVGGTMLLLCDRSS